MISSWVGVPPPSSLTGVPSWFSAPGTGLRSLVVPGPGSRTRLGSQARPRSKALKPGFPWRKLWILDSKVEVEMGAGWSLIRLVLPGLWGGMAGMDRGAAWGVLELLAGVEI